MIGAIRFVVRNLIWAMRKLRYPFLLRNVTINKSFRIDGKIGIQISGGTSFQSGLWLYSHVTPTSIGKIDIGNNCSFGYNNHITSVFEVKIGNEVLTANNVYISDNIHGYEDIKIPILRQPIVFKNSVVIGDGAWIGENVSVIGARIGRNSVIGANSVVTSDVPDYCVAVGAPAKVIKKYDSLTGLWIKL